MTNNNTPSQYSNLNAYTLVPNQTYLSRTDLVHNQTPLNGSTLGLMMLLSTFQYQAPHMAPTYSNAASQAGKAAFIVSGGQSFQDKLIAIATNKTLDLVHSIGITNTELGVVFGTAKVLRDRKIDFNGPKLFLIKTNLTFTPNSANLGFKYEW